MSEATRPGPLNAMTVDVEEHFQVSAFERVIERESWSDRPSRVQANTERLLDLFEETGVRATFFVLGWIAQRKPDLVRRIADRGHEIGSHGYSHSLVYDQQPEVFREETARSKILLEEIAGRPVTGYRAASFSIGWRNLWALDVLAELGFRYDSSLFPVYHDRYGMPGAPRRIHEVTTPGGSTLVEVPPSTLRFGRANLPVAGGGYLRLFPELLSHWAIRRLNRREGMPAVVYVHPWELDPAQPRIRAPLLSRLRHYGGLRGMEAKLRRLLVRFRFGPVERVIEEAGAGRERAAAVQGVGHAL
jgi:polysaccharide deacetylase family protein (PEP-CTERM system associated)